MRLAPKAHANISPKEVKATVLLYVSPDTEGKTELLIFYICHNGKITD